MIEHTRELTNGMTAAESQELQYHKRSGSAQSESACQYDVTIQKNNELQCLCYCRLCAQKMTMPDYASTRSVALSGSDSETDRNSPVAMIRDRSKRFITESALSLQ